MIISILANWIATRRKKYHNHTDQDNDNDGSGNNNSNGGILMKPVGFAVITLLCLVPLMFVSVMGQQDRGEFDSYSLQVAPPQEEEEGEEEEEEDDTISIEEVNGQGGLQNVDDPDSITTATPETGIVTTPLSDVQEIQESETGTPMGPEVTNPGVNPRATLPQSVQLQEYQDFQAALAQNGYNFNDRSVLYTQAYGDGRTVMVIMGTEGNTDQPPAMILEQLAISWGFQMLTYAYNAEGQLVTVFLEAF